MAPTKDAAIEQAKAMAARGWPPLTVDGRKVAAYMTHLAELISRLPQGWEGIQLDSDALEEIQRFSSQPKLPPSILAALNNVPPGAYTIKVMQALHDDPEGYARTTFDTPPPYTQVSA
eukprot:XP_001702259.1 predicted protein [Chlamydomonas reinhardtii]